jgi:3',5'-cyclic AMP phosphodiesterase CpdA
MLISTSNFAYSQTINQIESNSSILSEKPEMIQRIEDTSSVKIIYPLSSVPVIVEKEGQFTIRLEASEFDEVYAYISTAYEPVVDNIWLDVQNVWSFEDTWYINVTVPSIAPEELYNITLLLNQGNMLLSASQPRAVNVVEEFTDDFSFIHITDFHVGDLRGFTESIWKTIGWKSIKRCIHEINLLKPDFVIISGDLVYGQLYPFEYSKEYKNCYEMIQMFDVPTYLCPGNHDGYRRPREDGLKFWTEYFGPHYYSFDYGDYHFQAINSYDLPASRRLCISFIPLNWGGSIQDEQLQWIEKDLNENSGELNFMFMHHNPLWDTTKESLVGRHYKNREQLISIINQNNIDMVLAGHVHFDNVTKVNDTIFITTTTPESGIDAEDGYWGYRLIEIDDGEISSYNYKEPKYSIPSYKIQAKYPSLKKAKIENQLETDINAHITFVLPKNNYEVDNGEIVMQRENEESVEIYVKVLVAQNTTMTVQVSRVKNSNPN